LALNQFLQSLGIPGTLIAYGLKADDPALISRLPRVLGQPDMKEAPCLVDEAMLYRAVLLAESLGVKAA